MGIKKQKIINMLRKLIILIGSIIVLIVIFFFLFRKTSYKEPYLKYYSVLKNLPVEKFLGWNVNKREDDEVYRFRYKYLPNFKNCFFYKNKDNVCEISFKYSVKGIKFAPINDTLQNDDENYSFLACALGSTEKGIKDTIKNLINLYFSTQAISVRSDPAPSNFIIFTFENKEEIVLIYIRNSASSEETKKLLLDNKKLDKNWYFHKRF